MQVVYKAIATSSTSGSVASARTFSLMLILISSLLYSCYVHITSIIE